MKCHRLQKDLDTAVADGDKRVTELETLVDVASADRDRTMQANSDLQNEVSSLSP